jgi:hypothetical protein
VLSSATDRFERRLGEEMAHVRVDIASLEVRLQQSLAGELGSVRQEIALSRVELLKWSFLFWVGQVMAIAGLLAFMLPR